jgi:hypothetical protein
MVNTTILSRYTGELPINDGDDRKISGGPLYPIQDVLPILATGEGAVRAWTEKCIRDMQKWTLEADDLCELIETALKTGRFLGAEWCVQKPNGPWAACDAYRLVRSEWIPNAHRYMDIAYYIKFAVSKTERVLLVVSCHLSEDRRS